jgi:hypothetical protein
MTRTFEAILKDVSPAGELAFMADGREYKLPADNGTVGETPTLPSSRTQWRRQIGLRGQLNFTWHATTAAPALFSFCAYLDQSLMRVSSLDDVNPVGGGRALGWKSFNQPWGFLAKSPSLVRRA